MDNGNVHRPKRTNRHRKLSHSKAHRRRVKRSTRKQHNDSETQAQKSGKHRRRLESDVRRNERKRKDIITCQAYLNEHQLAIPPHSKPSPASHKRRRVSHHPNLNRWTLDGPLEGLWGRDTRQFAEEIRTLNKHPYKTMEFDTIRQGITSALRNNQARAAFKLFMQLPCSLQSTALYHICTSAQSRREVSHALEWYNNCTHITASSAWEHFSPPCEDTDLVEGRRRRYHHSCILCRREYSYEMHRVDRIQSMCELFYYGLECRNFLYKTVRDLLNMHLDVRVQRVYLIFVAMLIKREGKLPESTCQALLAAVWNRRRGWERAERISLMSKCERLRWYLIEAAMEIMLEVEQKGKNCLEECFQPQVFRGCSGPFESVDLLTRNLMRKCEPSVDVPMDVRRVIFRFHGGIKLDANVSHPDLGEDFLTPVDYACRSRCFLRTDECRLLTVLKTLLRHGAHRTSQMNLCSLLNEHDLMYGCPNSMDIISAMWDLGVNMMAPLGVRELPENRHSLLALACNLEQVKFLLEEIERREANASEKWSFVNGYDEWTTIENICMGGEFSVVEERKGMFELFMRHSLFDLQRHDRRFTQLRDTNVHWVSEYWEVREEHDVIM